MRHFIGIGHSHLHAVSRALLELAKKHPSSIRYTPICVLDAPYKPGFQVEDGVSVPNTAMVDTIRRILDSGDDVSIFLYVAGSEAFRWSLTPGPRPFDFIDPVDRENTTLAGEIIPYDLLMAFAMHAFGMIVPFANMVRSMTDLPLVQFAPPPPAPHLPDIVERTPAIQDMVGDYGVSDLAFRMKVWRFSCRAFETVCRRHDIGFIDCPPEALNPTGGLRDDMEDDVVHGNIVWGRLLTQMLLQRIGIAEEVMA